jgi:hypothetical protein
VKGAEYEKSGLFRGGLLFALFGIGWLMYFGHG